MAHIVTRIVWNTCNLNMWRSCHCIYRITFPKLQVARSVNEATSDFSFTITGYVPHLIVVCEEVKVAGFFRKNPLYHLYVSLYAWTHVHTHGHIQNNQWLKKNMNKPLFLKNKNSQKKICATFACFNIIFLFIKK